MRAPTFAMVDGLLVPHEEATVSIADRGFLYGDAVFETVAVRGGRPFRLDEHLQRLAVSMHALRFAGKLPGNLRLQKEVLQLIDRNRLADGLVRLCVTRGRGARGLDVRHATVPTVVISAHPPPAQAATLVRSGAHVVVASIRKVPPQCLPPHAKHANALNGILAHADAAAADAYEALQLTLEGHVAECSFSNVFFAAQGRLLTPALALGILPGITRAAVIELARGLRLPLEEGIYPLALLEAADEVFLTNTGVGVVPVARLGHRALPAPGPITVRLCAAYESMITASASSGGH